MLEGVVFQWSIELAPWSEKPITPSTFFGNGEKSKEQIEEKREKAAKLYRKIKTGQIAKRKVLTVKDAKGLLK